MKISELIELLQQTMTSEGDLEVTCYTPDERQFISDIFIVDHPTPEGKTKKVVELQ